MPGTGRRFFEPSAPRWRGLERKGARRRDERFSETFPGLRPFAVAQSVAPCPFRRCIRSNPKGPFRLRLFVAARLQRPRSAHRASDSSPPEHLWANLIAVSTYRSTMPIASTSRAGCGRKTNRHFSPSPLDKDNYISLTLRLHNAYEQMRLSIGLFFGNLIIGLSSSDMRSGACSRRS